MTEHPEADPPADHLYDHHTLPPEPVTRRIHQYGLMIGLAVLVVVFTVWVSWSYSTKRHEAQRNAQAASVLCRQLTEVGQPCAAQPVSEDEGVSGAAQMPAPTASLEGSAVAPSRGGPLPTDENGVPQAFQPGEDAQIVNVQVYEGRLLLTFDDGARVDAGQVNEDRLAIVVKPSSSPSPSPSPSPSLSPADPLFPPGADAPDPTDDGSPKPKESPS